MVRREGTRFGINTNHNVRRLPFPYKNVCAQQNVVIETKLDAEGHQSKKQAKMTLKKQLQKDTFNTQPGKTYLVVLMSRNQYTLVSHDIIHFTTTCFPFSKTFGYTPISINNFSLSQYLKQIFHVL